MKIYIDTRKAGDWLIVKVFGEVDQANSPDLLDYLLTQAAGPDPAVAVDASALEFIDSSGLGALVSVRMELARRDREFAILDPTKPVARTLQVSGLDHVLRVVCSESELSATSSSEKGPDATDAIQRH